MPSSKGGAQTTSMPRRQRATQPSATRQHCSVKSNTDTTATPSGSRIAQESSQAMSRGSPPKDGDCTPPKHAYLPSNEDRSQSSYGSPTVWAHRSPVAHPQDHACAPHTQRCTQSALSIHDKALNGYLPMIPATQP